MSDPARQRQSVFGGLLLILIGVLFLLHHFRPELGIGHLFRMYWPLILIFWGLIKLIENFAPRAPGEARGPIISGGEIALLLLLVIVALGLEGYDHVRRQFPEMDMGDMWTQKGVPVNEELPPQTIPSNSTISIRTTEGDITVFPDDGNQLRVAATKTVSSISEDKSRKRAEQISVAIAPEGKLGYAIQPTGISSHEHVRVNFEVHVPKQASIVAKTDTGDINISDLTGTITATSQKGDIEIHDTGAVTLTMQNGDVRVNTIKGDVSVKGPGNDVNVGGVTGNATLDGDFYGSVQLENISQTVRFTSSRTSLLIASLPGQLELDSGSLQISNAPGNIRVATRDRDVSLDNTAGRIEIADAHGDISVSLSKSPKDEISITNDTGGIDLALPSTSTFEISAASRSGDVDSEFEATGLSKQTSGDTTTLNGKLGTRGPKISLATSYGTINLRKTES